MQLLGSLDRSLASRSEAIGHVAECFGELNLVHPFREGNGRTLRLFFEHFLVSHGHAVDWSMVERDDWVAACIAAVDCDYAPLEEIFDRCIGDLLRSEEHTSELQSLMRSSYAVFCLKKKNRTHSRHDHIAAPTRPYRD